MKIQPIGTLLSKDNIYKVKDTVLFITELKIKYKQQ